jgi:hypothetical protein
MIPAFAQVTGILDPVPMGQVASRPFHEVDPDLNLDCNVRPGRERASGLWPVPASIPRYPTNLRWR